MAARARKDELHVLIGLRQDEVFPLLRIGDGDAAAEIERKVLFVQRKAALRLAVQCVGSGSVRADAQHGVVRKPGRLNLRLRKRLAAGHHADQRVLLGKVGLLARYILPGEPPCVGYFRSLPDKAHLQTVLVQFQQAVVQRTLHAKLVAQQFVVANKALAVQRPLQVKGKARIVLALTALFEQQVVRVLLIGFVENAVVAILLNKDILAGDVVLSAVSACGKAHRQQRRQHQRKQGSQFLVHGVPPFCQTLSNSADR